MLDFKVKRLDNIKFSHDEVIAYYEEVTEHYQYLKWTPPADINIGLHSWAVQTKLKDITKPCNPYHLPGDNKDDCAGDFDTPTELVFGFAKKVIDVFPEVKQTVITVHYPGATLPWHKDEEEYLEDHWKIHIPIVTNSQSYFQYEDEEFSLETGHAYLVNTSLTHATANQGTTDRAHLIFKVPVSRIEEILTRQYVL